MRKSYAVGASVLTIFLPAQCLLCIGCSQWCRKVSVCLSVLRSVRHIRYRVKRLNISSKFFPAWCQSLSYISRYQPSAISTILQWGLI